MQNTIRAIDWVSYHAGWVLSLLGILSVTIGIFISANMFARAEQNIYAPILTLTGLFFSWVGSIAFGALLKSTNTRANLPRLRYSNHLLTAAIIGSGISFALFALSQREGDLKAVSVSIIAAVTLALAGAQHKHIQRLESTRESLRYSARMAYEPFERLCQDLNVSSPSTERVNLKFQAASGLYDYVDDIKRGNVSITGNRYADFGSLLMLEYLQERLGYARGILHKTSLRFPDEFKQLHKTAEDDLVLLAKDYLWYQYKYLEDGSVSGGKGIPSTKQ